MMLPPIRYTLRFPNTHQHLTEVEALIPTDSPESKQAADSIILTMPVWTPGSYLVREYARHVEHLSVSDAETGEGLSWRKLDKHRWEVHVGTSRTIVVRYQLYCRESSVRTNWVDEEYGFLTGAATFLTREDAVDRPHTVQIFPPPSWPHIACSLFPENHDSLDELDWKTSFARRADSFDELIDSPILMGDLDIQPFEVGGRTHYLASYGTRGGWDHQRAVTDCARIVAGHHRFWKEIPYPHYWFLNLAVDSFGGLEHDNNTVLMTQHWAMHQRSTYLEWLGLVSHEFFHTWNVRRLRPKSLMQYNYRGEQYLPELWIAEGVTSYYDDLILLRVGLASPDEYLGMLGKIIQQVEEAPGRLVQSLQDASWDTWIKHYRPDENAVNSRISYYTKGAVVSFLLDVYLRKRTAHRFSLDDVMRELWRTFRHTGYTLGDFKAIASRLAGIDLSLWFDRHVSRPHPLDYSETFHWLGLTTEPITSDKTSPSIDLGCDLAKRDGRWIVTRVLRNGSASQGGLQVDDELIAINHRRLPVEAWKDRLQLYRDHPQLTLTIARRGRLIDRTVTPQPNFVRTLRWIDHPTEEQLANRHAWLYGGGDAEPSRPYLA